MIRSSGADGDGDDDEFPFYLKEWRQHCGLSQECLAARLRTTKGEVSRYERGERTLSLRLQFRIGKALGIEAAQLFYPPEIRSADAMLAHLPQDERDRLIAALELLIPPKPKS